MAPEMGRKKGSEMSMQWKCNVADVIVLKCTLRGQLLDARQCQLEMKKNHTRQAMESKQFERFVAGCFFRCCVPTLYFFDNVDYQNFGIGCKEISLTRQRLLWLKPSGIRDQINCSRSIAFCCKYSPRLSTLNATNLPLKFLSILLVAFLVAK